MYIMLALVRPKITLKPKGQDLKEGEKAVLNCKATSTPPSKISWFKDDDDVKLDNDRVFVLPNGTLVINKVIPGDSGKYQCSADHDGGWSESAEATLNVMGKFSGVAIDDGTVLLSCILAWIVFHYLWYYWRV